MLQSGPNIGALSGVEPPYQARSSNLKPRSVSDQQVWIPATMRFPKEHEEIGQCLSVPPTTRATSRALNAAICSPAREIVIPMRPRAEAGAALRVADAQNAANLAAQNGIDRGSGRSEPASNSRRPLRTRSGRRVGRRQMPHWTYFGALLSGVPTCQPRTA